MSELKQVYTWACWALPELYAPNSVAEALSPANTQLPNRFLRSVDFEPDSVNHL